jgi:hypothetical protein
VVGTGGTAERGAKPGAPEQPTEEVPVAKEKSQPAAKKAPARKAATTRTRTTTGAPSAQMIAERAYYLHLEGGSDPLANWVQAEQELAAAVA